MQSTNSEYGSPYLATLHLKQKSHWITTINGKMNVWKCELISPTDTLQQKIEITEKTFLAGENTSVLIILATIVYVWH